MSARASIPALLAVLALASPAAAHAQSRRSDGREPRERVEPSFGVRLGAVSAFTSAASGTPNAAGTGGYVMFDIPGLLADVSADLFFGEDRARLVQAGFGAYFPFGPGETTPYLGGGLKLGWSRFGGDGAFGLHPFASIGLLIGRSWSPHIRADLSYFVSTGTESRGPGFSERRASGPIATFGIGF
jgi:hypothetical protein